MTLTPSPPSASILLLFLSAALRHVLEFKVLKSVGWVRQFHMNLLCSALSSIFVSSKLGTCLYVWYPQECYSQLFSATSSCVEGLNPPVFISYDNIEFYCMGSPVGSIFSLFLCSPVGGAERGVRRFGETGSTEVHRLVSRADATCAHCLIFIDVHLCVSQVSKCCDRTGKCQTACPWNQ